MKPSPLKLGIVGAFAYFASVAWVFVYFRVASRNDPARWIVDRATPEAPRLVAMVGVGCVLASIVWAIVRRIRPGVQLRNSPHKNAIPCDRDSDHKLTSSIPEAKALFAVTVPSLL
jgi:hypothetical protein